MEYNMLNKEKLICELREIHKKLVNLYEDIFSYKYDNDKEFSEYIKNQYTKNNINKKDRENWNQNFCHRASYTLLNKILFVRICEDKGFMRNPEDYIAGEIGNPHIGEKLSNVGLQKWTNLITNFTFVELVDFAFLDMKESYKSIVLYKDNKYEMLNPTFDELNIKYINKDKSTKGFIASFENILSIIIEKLDTKRYNFAKTDSNILGDVYEQFMDRETRKAIGQFYTPEFIIEYILKTKVKEVDVLKNPFIKILDIACGSGHFLIMAYDILREKFLEKLEELNFKYKDETYEIKKNGKKEYINGKNYWVKENIHYHLLKHCIFGSDIDSFAVQLTTINLLLKDLDNFVDELNIIECNSLIKYEEDYNWRELKEQLEEQFEIETSIHVNLFGEKEILETKKIKDKFKLVYRDVFGLERKEEINREKAEETVNLCNFWSRKFDYVLGNPPYIEVKKIDEDMKPYLRSKYMYKNKELIKGRYDIYWAFFKRGIDLLKEEGFLSFVTSISYLDAISGDNLRKYMLQNSKITDITYTGKFSEDVSVFTVVTSLQKTIVEEYTIQINSIENNKFVNLFENKKSYYLKQPNQMIKLEDIEDSNIVLEKMENKKYSNLEEIVYIQQGIILQTKENKKDFFIYEKKDNELVPYLEGKDIGKYYLPSKNRYLYYEPKLHHRPRIPEIFKMPKLLIRRISNSIQACIDKDGYYHMDNTIFTVNLYNELDDIKHKYNRQLKYSDQDSETSKEYSYSCLFGIINSKSFEYYFSNKFNTISLNLLKQMPIPKIDSKYKSLIEKNSMEIQDNNSYIINRIDNLVNIIKDSKDIIKDYFIFKESIINMYIENEKMLLEIDIIIYLSYKLEKEEVLLIEKENYFNERIEFIKKYYHDSLDENYFEFCRNNFLFKLKKTLDQKTYIEEYFNSQKSIKELSKEYNSSIVTMNMLHNDYIGNLSIVSKYNSTDLYKALNKYLIILSIKCLNSKKIYLDIKNLSKSLKENFNNVGSIVEIIQKDNLTKNLNKVIEDSLNTNIYTWNAYRKDKESNKLNKDLVKYYDSDYYGLSEWSDEIHKHYFLDAIEEYTETEPNEKKAKDILKLFKDLDIEDKNDYLGVIEGKINRVFK